MNNDSQVAVFIDYDNIEISATEKLGKDAEVEWARVLEAAVQIGRVVTRRAYADWSAYGGDAQRELLGLGIELVQVSSKRGKNAADIRIVIDALEMLFSERNNITHVMLVSGDGDFTELVHRLRTRGLFVIGLGVSGTSAEYLVNACDEFIFYDRLVGITPQPPRASAGSGKQKAALRDEEVAAPSFDISEARQLLRRVLQA
ncbi:MAG: NYN domain-containing protein, partial [Anaerolineales bacterium]